jgi:threonine aldolase
LLYEVGGPAAMVGAVLRPLGGPRGLYTAAQVREAIRPPAYYMPRTRAVSVEQTSNVAGGVCWPLAQIEEVCATAHAAGLVAHMDGARLLNAVVASGTSARAFAAPFDSVWIDLSKGLGAPMGAVLAGSSEFIAEAWRFKQRFGGAMRQAGIVAAAGVYALQHHVDRLAQDHERARRLAGGLAAIRGVAIDPARVETNIVIFDVSPSGLSGEAFGSRTLASHGVRFSVLGPTTVRAVTHLDIPSDGIERALEAARAAVSV